MRRATLLRMMPGLAVILAIAVVTLFSALRPEPVARAAGGKALTPVRFNMSWLPQGSMAGVFVALDRGYYADAGLRVEAMRGFGGTRTVNELDRGMFEFGYVDPLSVAMNRASGGHARLVGGINMRFPAGACFVRERHHIASPADLAGKSIAVARGTTADIELTRIVKDNSVNANIVRYEDEATTNTAVATGQQNILAAALSTANDVAEQNPALNLEVKLNMAAYPMAVGLRKGDDELKTWVNEWVAKNLENGKLNAIYEKYFHQPLPKTIPEE